MDCTVVTRDNLSSHVPSGVQFEIKHEDSQTLSELDDMYRLVQEMLISPLKEHNS